MIVRGQTAARDSNPSLPGVVPANVEAGDYVAFLFIVIADDEVTGTDPSDTFAITTSGESQPLTFVSVLTQTFGSRVLSYVSMEVEIDAALAAEIVAEDGYSGSGTGVTFLGPSSIEAVYQGSWWIDMEGITDPTHAPLDATLEEYAANTNSEDASASLGLVDGASMGLWLAGTAGPTTDNNIGALTGVWAGLSGSSSLSRAAGGGAWNAASVSYSVTGGSITGTITFTTNDTDDDIEYIAIVASVVSGGAAEEEAVAGIRLSLNKPRFVYAELPYQLHTRML